MGAASAKYFMAAATPVRSKLFTCQHCYTCLYAMPSKVSGSDAMRWCATKGCEHNIGDRCSKFKSRV